MFQSHSSSLLPLRRGRLQHNPGPGAFSPLLGARLCLQLLCLLLLIEPALCAVQTEVVEGVRTLNIQRDTTKIPASVWVCSPVPLEVCLLQGMKLMGYLKNTILYG